MKVIEVGPGVGWRCSPLELQSRRHQVQVLGRYGPGSASSSSSGTGRLGRLVAVVEWRGHALRAAAEAMRRLEAAPQVIDAIGAAYDRLEAHEAGRIAPAPGRPLLRQVGVDLPLRPCLGQVVHFASGSREPFHERWSIGRRSRRAMPSAPGRH